MGCGVGSGPCCKGCTPCLGELPTGRRPRDALPSATGVSQMRTPCEPDPCELPGVQASMEVVQRGLSREGPRGGRCTGRGRRARHPAAWLTVMEIHYLHRSELLSMAVMLGQRTRRTHAGQSAHRGSPSERRPLSGPQTAARCALFAAEEPDAEAPPQVGARRRFQRVGRGVVPRRLSTTLKRILGSRPRRVCVVADVAHLSEWKVDGSVLGVASRELVIQLDAFPGVQAAPIAWRRPPEPICSTPGNGCGRACSGGSVEQCTVGGREGAQAARNRGCSHCEGVGRRLSSFFLELSSEDTAAFEARVTARRAAVKGAPPSVRRFSGGQRRAS